MSPTYTRVYTEKNQPYAHAILALYLVMLPFLEIIWLMFAYQVLIE